MAKVVVKSLDPKGKAKTGKNGRVSVGEKRVRGASGKVKTLRTIDAGSLTFGEDMHYVFGKNVAKARRENARIVGAADGVATKR